MTTKKALITVLFTVLLVAVALAIKYADSTIFGENPKKTERIPNIPLNSPRQDPEGEVLFKDVRQFIYHEGGGIAGLDNVFTFTPDGKYVGKTTYPKKTYSGSLTQAQITTLEKYLNMQSTIDDVKYAALHDCKMNPDEIGESITIDGYFGNAPDVHDIGKSPYINICVGSNHAYGPFVHYLVSLVNSIQNDISQTKDLITFTTQGGDCYRTCDRSYVVATDGKWRSVFGDVGDQGTLSKNTLRALRDAIDKYAFSLEPALREKDFCSSWVDAPDNIYKFRKDDIDVTISSCVYNLGYDNKLLIELNNTTNEIFGFTS